jgi:hypothetical protein
MPYSSTHHLLHFVVESAKQKVVKSYLRRYQRPSALSMSAAANRPAAVHKASFTGLTSIASGVKAASSRKPISKKPMWIESVIYAKQNAESAGC